MAEDENTLNPGLESITGHPSDGSSGSGAEKGKTMTLGDYKGLQSQVVGVGEGNLKLGLLLSDFLVRLAHLQGLDPEKALADEKQEHVDEQEAAAKQEAKDAKADQDAPTHRLHGAIPSQEPDAPMTKQDASKHNNKKDGGKSWL